MVNCLLDTKNYGISMPTTQLKKPDGSERLKVLKHKGISILSCDFSGCSRDEGQSLLEELVAFFEIESNGNTRVFFDVNNTTHDSKQANEWKRHLTLFNKQIAKSAIIGLSPLQRIAIGGILTFGRMVSQEKTVLQLKIFDSRDDALDYLASEK